MEQGHSKNHHYLPIFFQKGFCNEENMIHVYDKKNDTYLPKSPPKKHFYKKHLNNYRFEGRIVSSYEESIFSPMDSKSARVFRKIINNKIHNDISTPKDKIEFLIFMTNLFWRTPSSDETFREIIEKEGVCNNYFGLYQKETGTRLSDSDFPEIKEKMLKDNEFLKTSKLLIPTSDANKEEILKLVMKWKLFLLEPKSKFSFITGDSPLLFENNNIRLGQIFNKVIFPFSKNQVLLINEKRPNFIDDLVVRGINMSIIHKSKRFIASGDLKNLEYFVGLYKEFIKIGKEKEILQSTFGLIDYIAQFKEFEHYRFNVQKQTGGNSTS